MTVLVLHNAVEDRAYDEVEIALSIPLTYDNMPDLSTAERAAQSVWGRLTILLGETPPLEAGTSPFYRRVGVAIFQLFARIETGQAGLLTKAGQVEAKFRRQTVAGVRYLAPTTERIGREIESDWWQVNVRCPFEYDETL